MYEQRYIELWTHDDVLNFIDGAKLDLVRPLFEDEHMDGRLLFTLYEQCESNMESTYQLLNSQLRDYHSTHLPLPTYLCFVNQLRQQYYPINIGQIIRRVFWTIAKQIQQLFFSDLNSSASIK